MNKYSIIGLVSLITGLALTIFSWYDGSDFISGFLVGSGIGITVLGVQKKTRKRTCPS